MHYLLFPLFLLIQLTAYNAQAYPNASKSLQMHEINSSEMKRHYYLHIPPSYPQDNKKRPLVLVLHGGGKGNVLALEKNIGFTKLADRENFILAYPKGINGNWNDGRGITYKGQNITTVNDVTFISDLIDHLISSYPVDADKVYVTGLSNGGMMTLRLGCEISGKLTAIAPVIANIPKNIIDKCQPDSPVSMLIMNGTEDPLVPYEGGTVRFLFRRMGEVVSTQETFSFWANHHNCAITKDTKQLPDIDPDDHSKVEVTSCIDKNHQQKVVLFSIVDGGHTLPGSNLPDRPRIVGIKNNDIVAVEEIWKFFEQHKK